MIVLGGSSVGLELGQVFARFGTRVTIIEMLPRLIAFEDEEASRALRQRLEEEGLEIHTRETVTRVEELDGEIVVHAESVSGRRSFTAGRLMGATGRRPNLHGLGLESAGVTLDERGFICVDAGMRTSNPDVFAAGDVTGGPGFVYVAAAAGRVAAENALENTGRELDLTAVPRVTFTDPQVAAVGVTEAHAAEQGIDVEATRLELGHVPRALVEHRAHGWVKIVAERRSGRILGVHAVAPHAGELLGEATLAVRLGLTLQDIQDTMHPYLTWGEGLKLAAQSFSVDVSKLSCCA
jgi:mercuric reductase